MEGLYSAVVLLAFIQADLTVNYLFPYCRLGAFDFVLTNLQILQIP